MLRVYLTGELCLTVGNHVLRADRLPGRQGRTAFAYLVDRRAHPVPRDELADVLWRDRLPASFEVALSSIVSKLRALLVDVGLKRDALTSESGCYQLVLPASSWIDVETAIDSVHLAEAALLAGDAAAAYGPAVVACAILRRPFLPGTDDPWIEARRQTLRVAQLRALDCLAQIHMWNGEDSLALRAAQEAVDREPFRESGYRRLMLLHDQMGNGAESLRVYERLSRLLLRDLQTTPGSETRAVFESIAAHARSASSVKETGQASR
jgi:DNA-binding SARP family transcriptional activator